MPHRVENVPLIGRCSNVPFKPVNHFLCDHLQVERPIAGVLKRNRLIDHHAKVSIWGAVRARKYDDCAGPFRQQRRSRRKNASFAKKFYADAFFAHTHIDDQPN